jgi:GNAT superfamily N-acetyltransferase
MEQTMNLSFKQAIGDDVESLKQMDRELFPLDDPPDWNSALWFFVYSIDGAGNDVGFCSWKPVVHEGYIEGFHYRAGVLPAFQGKGIQKEMIKFRESEMLKYGIQTAVTYTDADNAPSMRSLISMNYRPYTPTEATCLSGGMARLGRVGFVHWYRHLIP